MAASTALRTAVILAADHCGACDPSGIESISAKTALADRNSPCILSCFSSLSVLVHDNNEKTKLRSKEVYLKSFTPSLSTCTVSRSKTKSEAAPLSKVPSGAEVYAAQRSSSRASSA